MTVHSYIRYPKTAKPVSLSVLDVAHAYNFPLGLATGKGYTAGLIELGGGDAIAKVSAFFTSLGLPVPNFVTVLGPGGKNKPDGPDGADGEVQSDMIVVGSVAPAATIRVYFGGNTDADFLAIVAQALSECNGVSCSWGDAESNWDGPTMEAWETAIKTAREKGVPFFVAAGDSGSDDSSNDGNQVDFPASSPSAIGCGGTRLGTDSSGARESETVWDDNSSSSATGGGVSKQFPGRDVPDIAGNADPDTGYEVSIDGQSAVIGGTSLVAPLMLGLHALLWELAGDTAFDMMNLIVTNPQACFDVTSGDNGAFRAGPGRDETTGFGVPDGAKLYAALTGGIAPPAPPAPVDPPVSPPTKSGGTVQDFPVALFEVLVKAKHNYNNAESVSVTAIQLWCVAAGLVSS